MNSIFAITLPIIIVVSLGYILRRLNIVREGWVSILNLFTYYISLPALIIASFSKINWDSEVATFLLFHAGIIIFASFILYGIFKIFKVPEKTNLVLILISIVGNTIYMGFPVLNELFIANELEKALGAATLQLTLGLVMAVILAEIVLKYGNPKKSLSDLAKNPLIISLLVGIFVSLFFKQVLSPTLTTTLGMLASTASPIALFALGAFLYNKFDISYAKKAFLAAGLKLTIFPLATWLLCLVFNFSPLENKMSVLISSMPAAVTTFVIAEKYKLDSKLAANAILLSTLLSVITVSFFIYRSII